MARACLTSLCGLLVPDNRPCSRKIPPKKSMGLLKFPPSSPPREGRGGCNPEFPDHWPLLTIWVNCSMHSRRKQTVSAERQPSRPAKRLSVVIGQPLTFTRKRLESGQAPPT